ncbi:uncharacterized protein IWZ02DRAFT_494778 [Phyllosticta citriasiana]|uniref:Uncharacterized protein n=1 Tax=Phyllosticta citriasiana TaxID=595635 RepID=A0ABR1KE44_9PEZI
MASPTFSKQFEEFHVEVLLQIAGQLGSMSPIHLEPDQENSLVSLSSTSNEMRDICQKLLFRGVIVDWEDLVDFLGKHQGLFSSVGSRQVLHGIPEKVKWTRSFAFKAGNETCKAIVPVTEQAMERAGLFLSHVLSTATRLSKLTVLLPINAKDFSLQNAMAVHGIPQLRLVKELVIDILSGLLLKRCPNATSVTIMGSSTYNPAHDAGIELLEHISNSYRGDQLHHYELAGALTSHLWMNHFLELAADLPRTMPELVSLTIVVHAHEHAPSRAWMKLGLERIARHFSQIFLSEHTKLQKVTLARILYQGEHMHYPEIVTCWERQRGEGSLEDAPFFQRSELDFGGLSHKSWRSTFEGPV